MPLGGFSTTNVCQYLHNHRFFTSCSVALIWLVATPWMAACQASLSFILSPGVCSNSSPLSQWCYLTLSHPLPPHLPFLPSIFPSIMVFSWCKPAFHIRWLKYWSFNFSISPSIEFQGWCPLGLTGLILQPKGLSKAFSTPQLKASVHWRSASFMVQLPHLYMTTGKPIALTIWTFVGKLMSAF